MTDRGSATMLIDEILRQTTVLVAQISTSAGVRAPLSRIADRVFFELAREIEAQGVGRKVAADMFGMALRTYQKRVQRLRESQSFRERTLWEAILSFVESTGSVTRAQIDKRFARDPEEQRGAVLADLVQSGLVYSTGRGEQSVFGPTSDADRRAMREIAEFEALTNLAWLTVYQTGPLSVAQLAARLDFTPEQAEGVAKHLLDAGRIAAVASDAGASSGSLSLTTLVRADQLMISAEHAAGWEAAFLDHFRAMATALANKVRLGVSTPSPGVGGATYAFNIHPQHPFEAQVMRLLDTTRQQIDELWQAVSAHNAAHPLPENYKRVTFYMGQNLLWDNGEDTQGSENDE
jgi:hypothetical protein